MELMDFRVDNDMNFLDDVLSLGKCDSLETVFLVLGHPMFDYLPMVMALMTKEITLCQKYQLPEALTAEQSRTHWAGLMDMPM